MKFGASLDGNRQNGVIDAPPLERPWWMSLHGEGPPVSDLDEVMDQFLCDHGAQAIEKTCRKYVSKFDMRNVERVVPSINQDQMEAMKKWYGHVTDFTKYRNKVEKQMDLRMQHKSKNQDLWDGSESDDDSSWNELPSFIATPSNRNETPDSTQSVGIKGFAPTQTMRNEALDGSQSSSLGNSLGTASFALGSASMPLGPRPAPTTKAARRSTVHAARNSRRLTHVGGTLAGQQQQQPAGVS